MGRLVGIQEGWAGLSLVAEHLFLQWLARIPRGRDRKGSPISQVRLGAEGLALTSSSQNRSRGLCGSWGRGLVSLGQGKACGRREGRGPALETTPMFPAVSGLPSTPFLCPLTSLSPEPRSMFTQNEQGWINEQGVWSTFSEQGSESSERVLSFASPGQVSPGPSSAMAVHLLPTYALFLTLLGMVQGSRSPMVPNQPFTTIWNANTQWCLEKYGVDVDVSVFDVVANPGQTFRGPDMTIFYSYQLGTYPYYTSAGEPVFGGLPQNASLDTHLARSFQDILAAIPVSDFSGLAVIDWEAWRPRWAFNWDTKDIYRQRSRTLVQGQHPDWPAPWVEAAARDQFQEAARAWMADTLKLGQALRPRGLWGFYGFPDCYNYDFLSPNYTGQCPPGISAQNDQLGWLWGQSRALYPSIYMPAELEGRGKGQMYVRHRVGEAFRVALGVGDPNLPVLPYAQIFYDKTNRFLPLVSLL